MCNDEALKEVHYRDIMSDVVNPDGAAGSKHSKLPYRDWAPLIKSVRFVGMKKNTMKFFVPNKYNGWETYIQLPDFYEQIKDTSLDANEVSRLLFWQGDIRVHCGCPSYLFWGFQYIMTELDAAIVPEVRFPTIRNPELKGVVCKHLRKTLKVLPFHLGKIAATVKQERSRLGIVVDKNR